MSKIVLIIDMSYCSPEHHPRQFIPMYIEAFNELEIEFELLVINSEKLNYYKEIFQNRYPNSQFVKEIKLLSEKEANRIFNIIIYNGEDNYKELYDLNLNAVIISGSSLDGNVETSFTKNLQKFCYYLFENDIPTLAICYGHQFITHIFGGKIIAFSNDNKTGNIISREMGLVPIFLTGNGKKCELFRGLPNHFFAYSSHKITVKEPPRLNKSITSNFPRARRYLNIEPELLAFNQSEIYQAFKFGNFYCVAFHPEITADRMKFLFEYRKKDLLQEGFCSNELHYELQKTSFDKIKLSPNPQRILKKF